MAKTYEVEIVASISKKYAFDKEEDKEMFLLGVDAAGSGRWTVVDKEEDKEMFLLGVDAACGWLEYEILADRIEEIE